MVGNPPNSFLIFWENMVTKNIDSDVERKKKGETEDSIGRMTRC